MGHWANAWYVRWSKFSSKNLNRKERWSCYVAIEREAEEVTGAPQASLPEVVLSKDLKVSEGEGMAAQGKRKCSPREPEYNWHRGQSQVDESTGHQGACSGLRSRWTHLGLYLSKVRCCRVLDRRVMHSDFKDDLGWRPTIAASGPATCSGEWDFLFILFVCLTFIGSLWISHHVPIPLTSLSG